MAPRPKTPGSSGTSKAPRNIAPRRKPRGKAKRPPRWDDAPRRGNPLGLVIAVAAALGLLYTACAPKVKEAGVTLPFGGPAAVPSHTPEPEHVVPRGRYEPPRRPRVAETPLARPRIEETTPAPERAPEAKAAPAKSLAMVVRRDVTVDAAVAPDSVEGLDASEMPVEADPTPAPPKPATAPPKPAAAKAASRPRSTRGEFAANPKAVGEVALTFDAAYDDAPLPRILQALENRGYRATFFLTGGFAERFPKSVKRISDAGMEIGNHSWSHPSFTKLSEAQIDRELHRTNDLLKKITGQEPNLFRPPFGARDDRVRRLVAEEGFSTIYWALDSWDSVRKGITAKEVADRVLSRVRPGDVVLMHIGSAASAEALPFILKDLDERGLRVVPVSDLMAAK